MTDIHFSSSEVIKVGLIGTGYAARLRADALMADARATLVAIAGHRPESITEFNQPYGAEIEPSWQALIDRSDLDLVIVSTVNQLHGEIVRAALAADKHVVVEYPLATEVAIAADLITLAASRHKLLHIEHIELLGGLHQAMKATVDQIGSPFYVRYSTINPQHSAPSKWTYQPDLFGFPLIGALSRLHRLTDLFGAVETVACQNRYAGGQDGFYATCLCTAQMRFSSGLLAEVTYGKGEALWEAVRRMEVQGSQGGLVFDGDSGSLINAAGTHPIEVGARRGLFAKDMAMVLDHLTTGAPLYVTPEASLYTLRVADAARRAAEQGQVIQVESVG